MSVALRRFFPGGGKAGREGGGGGGGQTSLQHLPIIGRDLLRHHLNTLVLNGRVFIVSDVTHFCLGSVRQRLLIDRSMVAPAFLWKCGMVVVVVVVGGSQP